MELIKRIYEHNDHRSSDKPNSISVTTLIGPSYKARKAIKKDLKDESLIDISLKRSSTLGTAFHHYAATQVFTRYADVIPELYHERKFEDYLITGSADGLWNKDGKLHLFDIKTGYGRTFDGEKLEKAIMQMSIYRWLLQELYNIEDEAYILFVSMSNNIQMEIPIQLYSIKDVEFFIENKLDLIETTIASDCNSGIKYNSCNYCPFICEERKK
jgi:hypothetical protein